MRHQIIILGLTQSKLTSLIPNFCLILIIDKISNRSPHFLLIKYIISEYMKIVLPNLFLRNQISLLIRTPQFCIPITSFLWFKKL